MDLEPFMYLGLGGAVIALIAFGVRYLMVRSERASEADLAEHLSGALDEKPVCCHHDDNNAEHLK